MSGFVVSETPGLSRSGFWAGYTRAGMQKVRIEGVMGTVWVGAWLFTIGFLHLAFWQGVLAVLVWPYYLGLALSANR